MDKQLTPPSTPLTTAHYLPAFITQSLEDIHQKFSQIKEYEKSIRPFSTSVFSHPVAFKRDRYFTIRPWDANRVELCNVRHLEHAYMNASRIDLGRKNERIVATQGPLDDEFGRFWRMVWQEKSEVVVMLTQPSEKGEEKCAVYYPEKVGEALLVDEDLRVSVQCLSVVEESKTLIRELKLVNGNEERTVWHLFFPHWFDSTAPQRQDQKAILDLIKMSRFRMNYGRDQNQKVETGPRIIHSSAGCGRTGTFISLDYLLQVMDGWETKELGDSDPVFETVKMLREQRTQMVNKKEQYVFLYQVLRELWEAQYKSGGFSYFSAKENKCSLSNLDEEKDNGKIGTQPVSMR
jgi:protein-tyrosine phosphatase